jgi:hypothetical protein
MTLLLLPGKMLVNKETDTQSDILAVMRVFTCYAKQFSLLRDLTLANVFMPFNCKCEGSLSTWKAFYSSPTKWWQQIMHSMKI